MSEDSLIRHCSPTLAGLKTGSLFSCACPCRETLMGELCCLAERLAPKGIRIMALRICRKRALIYVYRPAALERDLKNGAVKSLLMECGYASCSPDCCVERLMSRLKADGEFPHEIGLFLGYPPEDVRGFIDNEARNYKCTGRWKVYGDERAAKSAFRRFDLCSKIYMEQWKQGKSIEQLAVAD